MRRAGLLVLCAALVMGCQPARRGSGEGSRDPYLISAQELEGSARLTLYDAVWELRPRWFTRGARASNNEPLVYVEDQVLGTTGALRRFHPTHVVEVRYLSATEAQVQYGQRNGGRPAIVVVLARN